MTAQTRNNKITRKYLPVPVDTLPISHEDRMAAVAASDRGKTGSGREPDVTGMSILLVDDEPSISALLEMVLRSDGFDITVVGSARAAGRALELKPFDIVLVDKNLPDGSGLDILRQVAARTADCATLIITAYANVDSAVEAIRLGARDYLIKPFDDIELVRQSVLRVARMLALERKNAQLITALRASNEALAALAVRDPLTKLFNHAYLQDAVRREVARCQRYELECCLLFLDVDHFRAVNDSHGHTAGDQLLRALAEVLNDSRSASLLGLRTQDIAARYCDDRLAILLPETKKGAALVKADSLRQAVSEYDFASLGLSAQTVSVGVASYPDDAIERDELIRCAEAALVAAKNDGRDRVVGYSTTLAGVIDPASDSAQRARRVRALEQVIDELAFDLSYQPISWLESGDIFGFEARCHPRGEDLTSLQEMAHIAEQAGKIGELGRALRRCHLPALRALPKGLPLLLSLDPHELFDPDFASIERLFHGWTDRVILQLPGLSAFEPTRPVLETVAWLRKAGFRIALADVGQGYSWLHVLAELRPELIKLDSKLLGRAREEERTQRLLQLIVAFVRDEGSRVVAQDIGTREQKEIASELGCQLVQGSLIGPPQPLTTLTGR